MNWLIDTCALSEVMKRNPSPSVVEWFRTTPQDEMFVSVLTLGELRRGVAKLQGPRRDELAAWLENEIPEWFHGRVLPVDVGVAMEWGELTARLPTSVPAVDCLLAATALRHGLAVVTRNVVDFEPTGVQIVDPWSGGKHRGGEHRVRYPPPL